ncbi:MAG: SRPBCC family protein [Mycobacteriales bacterium]
MSPSSATDRQVSRTTVLAAAPQAVFDMLADPRRHPEFDGSGSVRAALRAPDRLYLGARFGMRMRLGLPYTIRNTVSEFEEGRRIAWHHPGRHVWRYELESMDGGQHTRLTETFDYAPARSPRAVELMGFPARNAVGIEATLRRLEGLFGTP